ncbi:MAG: hypothetical protein WC455_12570 [Dehalococcoidia bacterium]|jgi:hypothetical protein
MSSLSSALAAYLQNSDVIGPLVSGVISGRNFDLQDELLATSPYTCISVIDLISRETPYFGGDVQSNGQIEVSCISKASEAICKDLADLVRALLWATRTVPSNGANLPTRIASIQQDPDSDDELQIWKEILTIDII